VATLIKTLDTAGLEDCRHAAQRSLIALIG
jgi:hypothetical protein